MSTIINKPFETAFISEQRFTQAEFAAWLEGVSDWDVNRYELIDGRIVMTPPPGWPHGMTSSSIVTILS